MKNAAQHYAKTTDYTLNAQVLVEVKVLTAKDV
jgi:hypothetical protein